MNLAEIIGKKVLGKPLTKAEKTAASPKPKPPVQPPPPEAENDVPAYVRNRRDLAACLDVDHKTIGNLIARWPLDHPKTKADGRYDVRAWMEFCAKVNVKGRAIPAPDAETFAEWRRQKVKLECERIGLEIAKRRESLIEVSDLEATLGTLLSAFRTAGNAMVHRVTQKVVGLKDYHEIKGIVAGEWETVLRTLESCPFLPEDPPPDKP